MRETIFENIHASIGRSQTNIFVRTIQKTLDWNFWLEFCVSAAWAKLVTVLVVTTICKFWIWAVLSSNISLICTFQNTHALISSPVLLCFTWNSVAFIFSKVLPEWRCNRRWTQAGEFLSSWWTLSRHCQKTWYNHYISIITITIINISISISINIIFSSSDVIMVMTDLKQPLQSKYLIFLTRGARLRSAESVRASQPDKDNHWG